MHIKNAENANQQRVTFSSAVVSELWDASTFSSDLALIRVDTPFVLSDFVQPARLPSRLQLGLSFVGADTTVAGWGSIAPWVSPNQRFIRNFVMSRMSCIAAYPTMATSNNICTSGAVASPCQGDSGVAITITELDQQQTVIGALSFGSALGCGSNRPAVYTRLGPFMYWISSVTGVTIRYI